MLGILAISTSFGEIFTHISYWAAFFAPMDGLLWVGASHNCLPLPWLIAHWLVRSNRKAYTQKICHPCQQ